jgi:uncharacterized protein YbjT (DUF2867 family)
MKILLTGATGYIGKRLLPVLVSEGHQVICCVRDKERFDTSGSDTSQVKVIEVNFLDENSLKNIPSDIDVAYYLIHSMTAAVNDFERLEMISAENFRIHIDNTNTRQVIYLSGIINQKELSRHLSSRRAVEQTLAEGSYHLTTLRAGIIVGSGSASFEIIRDLVEKLPLMVSPRWLNTRAQPIAIRNVIQYLTGVILNPETFDNSFDIGGPDILTYREMLMQYASVRKLRRTIWVVPVMTPKLSSYWLYFITSTSYRLAVNLVNSMKVEVVCQENDLKDLLQIESIPFKESVERAFNWMEYNEIIPIRTDGLSSLTPEEGISDMLQVPSDGCLTYRRELLVKDEEKVLDRILAIRGKQGWYHANRLRTIRGFFGKLAGGVGMRRGRKNGTEELAGDSIEFWRVVLASREEKRLLLYAEMKLPGEAWMEFRIIGKNLYQTATFRPLGLWGRIYWYSLLPFHAIKFRGMIKRIAQTQS